MAAVAHQPFFEQLLADYDDRSFLRPDGTPDLTTNVTYITEACLSEGLVLNNERQTICGFTLYPSDYFCPKDWLTKKINLSENSHTVHHFDGSWASGSTRVKNEIMHLLGAQGRRLDEKVDATLDHPMRAKGG